jgi:Major Facilitator Superfamily.
MARSYNNTVGSNKRFFVRFFYHNRTICRNSPSQFGYFKNYNFVIAFIVNMVRAVGIFGAMFLLPLFIENVMNYNAMHAGILMAPTAIAVAIVSPFSGKISDRIGPRYPLICRIINSGLFNVPVR